MHTIKPQFIKCKIKFSISVYTHTHTCNYIEIKSQPVACGSCYSGGRDQEDHCSKPEGANSQQDSISKKLITHKKRAGGVAQGVGPEFKPRTAKKEKRKEDLKGCL
jgi:hypothetical protein